MALKFSPTERIALAFRLIILAPWQILATLLRSLGITWYRGLPPRLFLVCAVIKVVLETLSARQIQYLSLPTKEVYKAWISRRVAKAEKDGDIGVIKRLRYDIEPLEDAKSSLMWLRDRSRARKVVLFFHGGGYISPLLPGHLEWCWRSYVATGIEINVEVAVAVLEYTLCPEARYPVQLRQALSGLSHILSSGFLPKDIIIGGDSAGANLTAQLLCHLIQPHPGVRVLEITHPLRAVFLVSPWLSRCTHDTAFSENSWIDMLSAYTVDKSTSALLENTYPTEQRVKIAQLAFPLDMEKSCLAGLAAVADEILCTVGEHEVFRDQAGF